MTNIRTNYITQQFISHRSRAAFVKLYDLHTAIMFQLAMQVSAGNKPVAGEIVQHAWIRAIEQLPSLSTEPSFKTRIKSIVATCSQEYYHQQGAHLLLHDYSGIL